MNILVIGAGSIGSTLLRECEHIDRIRRCYVLDHHPEKLERLEDRYPKVVPVEDLDKTLKDTDLVVEAASQEAVKEFGPMALEAGADLMIMSVGALVDEDLRSELYSYDGDIYLPTGALCGIDAVYNASMAMRHRRRLQRIHGRCRRGDPRDHQTSNILGTHRYRQKKGIVPRSC